MDDLLEGKRYSLVRVIVNGAPRYCISRLLADGGNNYLHPTDKLIASGSWEAMKAAGRLAHSGY